MKAKRRFSLILCIILMVSMIVSPIVYQEEAHGAGTVPLTIEQAEAWAFGYSAVYQNKLFRYAKLCKKYQSAVKSVATKWEDFGTIRWTLLFGFDKVDYPYMDEAMDLYMKGPGIMTEINLLTRELYDTKFTIKKKIDDLFIKAFDAQEKIAFNEKQLEEAKKTLARNKNLLAIGDANPKEIDAMKKRVSTLEKEQTNLLRTQMNKMKAIKNLVGVDVTTGYQLVNPLVTAKLDRVDNLQDIIDYAEFWDLSIYDSDLDVSLGKQQVNMGIKLLREGFPVQTSQHIQPHIDKILNAVGNINKNYDELKNFDVKSFNLDYEQFLIKIDKPWEGNYKVWFIKIPKEWFKGKLDGIRYIENSQYLVLDAALQLKDDAMNNYELRRDFRSQIEDAFNSVKDAEYAYELAKTAESDAKKNLEMILNLNKLGDASYTETRDAQKSYEETQLNKIDSLRTYTELLYTLDRMSYGAISKLLKGESLELSEGNAGISYADLTDTSKAFYFLQPLVAGLNFSFGVNLPADYEPQFDSYELWYQDSIQIGKRTPVGEQIIHLTLDYGDTSELELRAFDGGKFVDKCVIDTSVPVGEINFVKALPEEAPTERTVGSYSVSNLGGVAPVATSITLKMKQLENIEFYTIVNEKDKPLISKALIPIETPFEYLTLIAGDVASLKIKCFGKDEKLKYTASFKADTFEIVAPIEP